MHRLLASRLDKLEAKLPAKKKPWRAVTVVFGEGQDTEVEHLLKAEGYGSDDEDLIVMRIMVVAPSAQEPYSKPPYILRQTTG